MDREAIQRRDFPVGGRGYDPEAVDAHLRRVADEFETLRGRAAGAPPATPRAARAAQQARQNVEPADAGAAEMRADAGRQASGHVARVQEAARSMLSRLDDLERELDTLLEALRQSGERLGEGLAQLQRRAGELGGSVPLDEAPHGDPMVPREDVEGAREEVASEDLTAPHGDPVIPGGDAAVEEPAGDNGPRAGDEAGARSIARNMALSGTPRAEAARYLAEHFTLADPEALLDDVYERAGR